MKSVMHPKTVVHRAEARGYADHGWLKSRFSFSFAEYYDPISAEPCGGGRFTWTAAMVLEFLAAERE